jgi:hypothetical protein
LVWLDSRLNPHLAEQIECISTYSAERIIAESSRAISQVPNNALLPPPIILPPRGAD